MGGYASEIGHCLPHSLGKVDRQFLFAAESPVRIPLRFLRMCPEVLTETDHILRRPRNRRALYNLTVGNSFLIRCREELRDDPAVLLRQSGHQIIHIKVGYTDIRQRVHKLSVI